MGAIIAIPIAVTLSILSARPSDFIFWCKWIISYIYIQSFRRLTKRRFDLYDVDEDHDPVKANFISSPEEIALESPLEEDELSMFADEVFCYGVNSSSEYLVVRIARGCNHEAEAWIYLKMSNGKVYQLKETSGYQQSCSERKAFTCGDLQMHYMTPMRTWRIFFNGLLRETAEDTTSEKMVHVKFALLWRASSDIFDFMTDVNAAALAKGLAKAKWTKFSPPLEKLNKALNFYSQCGIIMGSISIEGNQDEHNIYLFGERVRFLGDASSINNAQFLHVLGQVTRTGTFVHLAEVSIANVVENLTFGFIVLPTGEMTVVSNTIDLDNLVEKDKEKYDISANFQSTDLLYDLKANLTGKQVHFESREGWNGHLTIDALNFQMNSLKGLGVVINGKVLQPFKRTESKIPVYNAPSVIPFVVHFDDIICQDSNITGGKGSSLGKLTELSKEYQTFIVPNGIVVTTAAYKLFVTEEVLREIKHLEEVLYGNISGDVKEACQRVKDEILKSYFPDKILNGVTNCLHKAFPDKETVKFAVRSSATGEDTEQMSAAGQMETFLGVKGVNEIISAVKKCWASQFSYIAVQYKRQNGQIINSPMAVVIQKMIPCDVAGVLFTCDPLTGNPTIMSITANYGLGESVVSASEEPDTIELKRNADDKLSVNNKIIGGKSRRVVLQDGGEGTNLEEVSEKDRQLCCLTDEMALRLGNLAIKIEKSYRSHRDIEWGFWNNNLYIFQSRPVTSGTGETDFEIEHETDAPLRVENDYFTVCNVGEVMPGAMSPLGMDIVMKYFRVSFQRQIDTDWQSSLKPRYFQRGIICMYNHVMFYCLDLFENMNSDREMSEAACIGLFGRALDDEDLFRMVEDRFGNKKKALFQKQRKMITLFSRLKSSRKVLDRALEAYKDYRIPFEKYKTSTELFDALLSACTDLCEPMMSHMKNSESSSVWNMFVFSILKKARGELNADVYKDFAHLLTTSSDVESADVPASIDRLALSIAKEVKSEELKKMDVKDIIEWLQNTKTEAGISYREFLAKHGHRCLKEFDVRSKTWGQEPTTLIVLLKNLVGSAGKNATKRKDEDINKLIVDLGLSIGFITRLILKYLIQQSRKGVQNRETSKSLLIKSEDAWRKGYHHLAKLMVAEGRIPDEDLLFFMDLNEIRELISTRSPKIISRANHRRRRFPILDKYIFPEIMKGFPNPINMEDTTTISSDENFTMKGIPVSQGVTKAYVRVALTLEEAANLQPGEILLTYSTDIGWSPYFPILAGVVTELGGLISHGAVVSREYGLPCIAGLHGATRQFQTGDYVLLDGNKGILQRLPKPENSESLT